MTNNTIALLDLSSEKADCIAFSVRCKCLLLSNAGNYQMGVEAVKMIAKVLLTNKSLKHVELSSQCAGFRSSMLVFDVGVSF